jgi:hypothetical protein
VTHGGPRTRTLGVCRPRLSWLRSRRSEPPPGVEPGLLPYEGRAASQRAAAKLPERDSNSHLPGSEPGVLPFRRSGIECGRCDSNAQTTRFERARSAICRHARVVRRENFEISSFGLRARRSASEDQVGWHSLAGVDVHRQPAPGARLDDQAHVRRDLHVCDAPHQPYAQKLRSPVKCRAGGGSRTRMASLEGWRLMPFGHARAVGPAGIEPAYAGLQPAANPSQLETQWSGPAESNRVSPESESGRLPSSSIPTCAAPPWRPLSASLYPSI